MKKTVLCFGDSNTWGANPSGPRYGIDVRWPRRMAAILGDDCDVIEEGFNGRTCLMDDPVEGGHKSGAKYLPPCLMSHQPLDLVILMLGTNDTKQRFSLNAFTIAQGAGQLIELCRRYAPEAQVLLVSPIEVGENLMQTPLGAIFGPESIAISKQFPTEYKALSVLHNTHFLDAAAIAKPSPIDAIHMAPEDQIALAEALAAKVRTILG